LLSVILTIDIFCHVTSPSKY